MHGWQDAAAVTGVDGDVVLRRRAATPGYSGVAQQRCATAADMTRGQVICQASAVKMHGWQGAATLGRSNDGAWQWRAAATGRPLPSLVQGAHGFRQVSDQAQHQAGEAVDYEEGCDAHGFG